MAKSAEQTKQRSRKAALAGQLSPAQQAQAGVSSTMSRLDDMMKGMQSGQQAASATPTKEPERQAEPASDGPSPAAFRPQSVATLDELARLIEHAEDTLFVNVPVRLVRPSTENHRLLALDFDTFLTHLPAPPDDWRQLSPEDYVAQYWDRSLAQLYAKGFLDDHTLARAREQLEAQFGIGQSVQDSRQIHTTSGYLRFDQYGRPEAVELTSGEQRLRGYLMVGKQMALMDFPADAAYHGDDPHVTYQRQRLRVAENMKSTGLSVAEKLSALDHLMRSLEAVKGVYHVEGMTNNQLRDEFKTAIAMSKANAARYLKVVRNPQCRRLIELCDRFELGIAKINDLAGQVSAYAERHRRDPAEADVYVCALRDDDIPIVLDDVPPPLREDVASVVGGASPPSGTGDAPGHVLAERAVSAGSQAVTDNSPSPADPATRSPASPPRSGTSSAEASRRSRYNRSEAQQRLQKTMGWSVSKGPSNAEAHRNLYTNALLLVTLLEAPTIPRERVEQLRELLRLQGIPAEIDNFRAALAELVDSYHLPFEVLNRNHLQSQELLDRLAESSDSVAVIKAYLSEQQADTGPTS